jgi:hypothetical protein
MPELATSLLPDTQEALSARIERLIAWQPRREAPRRSHAGSFFILILLGLLVVAYGPLLRRVHELSELLIR